MRNSQIKFKKQQVQPKVVAPAKASKKVTAPVKATVKVTPAKVAPEKVSPMQLQSMNDVEQSDEGEGPAGRSFDDGE